MDTRIGNVRLGPISEAGPVNSSGLAVVESATAVYSSVGAAEVSAGTSAVFRGKRGIGVTAIEYAPAALCVG